MGRRVWAAISRGLGSLDMRLVEEDPFLQPSGKPEVARARSHTEDTCPACGAASRSLRPEGPIALFAESSYDPLVALFSKQFDNVVRCETCQAPLGVTPTVAVVFPERRWIDAVLGSRLAPRGERLLSDLAAERGHGELRVSTRETLGDLRITVAMRLAPMIEEVGRLFAAMEANDFEYVERNWRALTPAVFSTGRLIVEAPAGVMVLLGGAAPMSYSPEDALQILAAAQGGTWFSLVRAWSILAERGATLEEDLQRLIREGAIVPGAVDALLVQFDSMEGQPGLTGRDWYLIEAVAASVCAAAGRANPRADRWAEEFFDYEMTCALEKTLAPEVEALAISAERAQATVGYSGAWQAAARRLTPDPESHAALHRAAAKAGHRTLSSEVLARKFAEQPIEIEKLISYIRGAAREAAAYEDPADAVLSAARMAAASLEATKRVDDLERLAAEVSRLLGGGDEERGKLEAWVGGVLKEMREPQRFLDRIGAKPAEWEARLSRETQADLRMGRSNALRMVGRTEEALAEAQEVLRLLEGGAVPSPNLRHARVNLAVLLAEAGSPDEALTLLERTVTEASPSDRLEPLAALGFMLSEAGRHAEALVRLDEAAELAVGRYQAKAGMLAALRAHVLNRAGRYADAVAVLEASAESPDHDVLAFLNQAAAWAVLASQAPKLVPREAISRVLDELKRAREVADERGDAMTAALAREYLADFGELLGEPSAEELWKDAYAVRERSGQAPDPSVLLWLATHAYRRGQPGEARQLLRLLPDALAHPFGRIEDIGAAAEMTGTLVEPLNALMLAVFESQVVDWGDIRLALELRRDVLARAQLVRRRGASQPDAASLATGLGDDVIASLAPPAGSLAVLEWMGARDVMIPLLTRIQASGEVSTELLRGLDGDLVRLAAKMRARLANWTPGRQGDPFDHPGWRSLEDWLRQQLASRLAPNDHVVFFEHEDLAGLAWHLAAGPVWTSSYASGWSGLLALAPHFPAPPATLGVVLVPRFRESSDVLEALRESAARTKDVGARAELDIVAAEEHECDAAAFQRVMEAADVTAVLCHGFVSAEGEVALMLAHDGRLPLAHSVAAGTEAGQQHRMSWRECQHLAAAPAVVFSVACSTGVSQIRGLGERLGLFGALRQHGTRAVVAPHWDVVAASVQPVFGDALGRFLTTDASLAAALRDASTTAEQAGCPRWLAWSLALEGDWR
jgi:tetratricopeptide (TPR) repeat protein